jgi:hypothetical protein
MSQIKSQHAPQQMDPAHQLEGPTTATLNTALAAPLTGLPTLHGPPPPGLERRFTPAPAGQVPEWAKLPSPRERCPICGASRSWLLDQEKLGRIKIVRVRQPGRIRGACFVWVPSLLSLLRGELEKGGTK